MIERMSSLSPMTNAEPVEMLTHFDRADEFSLIGTITGEAEPMAMFRDTSGQVHTSGLGAQLGGSTVTAIEEGLITLMSGTQTRTLQLSHS